MEGFQINYTDLSDLFWEYKRKIENSVELLLGNLTFKSTATIVAKEGISMGAGAGAQKITTDVTGNDTAGMVAGMVASGVTAKGLNGIEAEANKLAKAPKGIDGVTEGAGNLTEDVISESGVNIRGAGDESGSSSNKFSNWDDMKDAYKGKVTKFLKENKPKGDTVPYINQQVKFPKQYMFPDEDIAEFSIGKFTGDRELDKKAALEFLRSEGYDEIPDGYVLHHDYENGKMQLIEEEIHRIFTHYGGNYYNK